MNNYPEWWDKKLTIYNKYTDSSTRAVTWYRTVLTDPLSFWKEVGDKTIVGGVELDTKSIICRIPATTKYVPIEEWLNLVDKTSKFTLQQDDIIVVGECKEEIQEGVQGKRSSDFLAKRRKFWGVMQIKTVAQDNMSGMIYKHYTVKGL